MASTSALSDPQLKKLRDAAERHKQEARESTRSLRIVQRKLDAAAELAEAKAREVATEKDKLHRAEIAQLKAKYEGEFLKLKQQAQPRVDDDDDDDGDADDSAQQLEEAIFSLSQARSENTRIRSEAESYQLSQHAAMEQRDEAYTKLAAEQARSKRMEESFKSVQEEAARDRLSTAGESRFFPATRTATWSYSRTTPSM